MTKTLTEQWKDGTIPDGYYYVKSKWSGKIEINDFFDGCSEGLKEEYIKEIIEPVPGYEDWKYLQERNGKLEKMAFHYTPEEWNTMLRTIDRLQKQLEEANTVILSLPAEKISTCMIACEYLDKWGVK